MSRPKHIFANSVNLSGLYSLEPIPCIWDYELGEWADASGNFTVPKLGEQDDYGHITFASKSKSKVKLWTDGAEAVMTMLRRWAGTEDDDD